MTLIRLFSVIISAWKNPSLPSFAIQPLDKLEISLAGQRCVCSSLKSGTFSALAQSPNLKLRKKSSSIFPHMGEIKRKSNDQHRSMSKGLSRQLRRCGFFVSSQVPMFSFFSRNWISLEKKSKILIFDFE